MLSINFYRIERTCPLRSLIEPRHVHDRSLYDHLCTCRTGGTKLCMSSTFPIANDCPGGWFPLRGLCSVCPNGQLSGERRCVARNPSPDVDSRMVSPENPTGEKAKGAMRTPDPANPDLAFSRAASDLGRGWKVRPFIKVPAHSTATIMDVSGPGTIGRDFGWRRRRTCTG